MRGALPVWGLSKMCSDDVSSSSENIVFVPAQFNLQPDEASASPDPKTSPRLSRASIFLTQILQVGYCGSAVNQVPGYFICALRSFVWDESTLIRKPALRGSI